ncbi:CapA family protein [Peloplasma aerotolerans]|uniref:CapA family protein n=1 Tax=Peloplasma aerotolerans TaxID=3044389 RepID=A0AAW6UBS1_9MOLU|nr:CapA family protein [Mariniplasma sp. M4Ah]MDI6452383.1 CapA family protein [Mariniplasma sp. M4Ah]
MVTTMLSYGDTLLENEFIESLPISKLSSHFLNSDIITFNLETVISDSITSSIDKAFNFKTSTRNLKDFKSILSDKLLVCNIANNHILDFGVEGLKDTIENMIKLDFSFVGYSQNLKVEEGILFREVNGIKFAFLGAHNADNVTVHKPGLTSLDESLCAKVNYAKHKSDFVILHLHWGEELSVCPSPNQVKFAHMLIESGVDVILGHHPHILQSIENYKNGIIAYSQGNFQMITYDYSIKTKISMILSFEFNQKKVSYKIIPVVINKRIPNLIQDPINAKLYSEYMIEADYYFKKNSWFMFYIYTSKQYLIDSLQAWKIRLNKREKRLVLKILRWLLSKKTITMFLFLPFNLVFVNSISRKIIRKSKEKTL